MTPIGAEGSSAPVGETQVAVRGRPAGGPGGDDAVQRSNLSQTQFLIWLGQEIDAELPLYNMIQTFRIEGRIDAAAFDQAWQMLVRRSDALRTTVAPREGVPWRTVHPTMPVPMEVVDLRGTPDPGAACRAWVEDRKVRTLRLGERLWDTALLLLEDEVAVWYLCQHHLITDGESFAITYRYVSECYGLATAGRLEEARRLPAYEDFLAHERRSRSSPAASRASDYWHARLAEPKRPTPFYGRAAAGGTARTERLVLDVGRERSERLRQIAGRTEFRSLSEGLSLHTIWATLLFTFLHRMTGQSALRVGTPFLGRPTAAFRETVGLFIEIGCLDVELDGGDTFPTLARRVQREVMQGMLHAPAGGSTAELNRSYDVLLNYVTSRFDPFAGHPVATDWVHSGYGDRDHTLRLQVADFDSDGAFRLHFDINVDVIGEVQRVWLMDQFQAVLDRFIEDPTRGLGSFDLLSPDQRLHQAEEFNSTDADYPRESTVVDLFEEQARATPDAIAVQSPERTLSYAQLDAEANRVAHLLQRHGVGPETTVALCVRRSARALAAILGVLKAGGAYVPIDPSYPSPRRRLMIDDAEPRVVVTAGAHLDDEGFTTPTLDLDATALDDLPPGPPPSHRRPEALAYVIYTSGSTGRPKGTLLTHGGLVNYLWWARQQYQQGEALDFPLYSSLSFDLTITSVFVPLISGGRVVVYEGSSHGEGLEILDVFADDLVDIVKLTPAHLSLLREQGIRCQRIRRLIVGGENFPTELARDISQSFPHEVVIFNEYGPTETVVGCMVHRYDPALDTGPSVPIGRPAANARVHVLDPHDQPTPPGVAGEIVVSGDGVARGYRNQPDLTAERFGDDPTRPGARWYRTGDLARWGADGRLEFLGRHDHQVKIRGARIELGEIEAALLAHPDVGSAVVDVVTLGGAAPGTVVHCVTCGLPSSYPGADIDDSGDCADCRAYSRHREQVARYFRTRQDLRQALDAVKGLEAGKEHDCLVLVSGGKDSTYLLYQVVREYGMRPLVFTLDNGYIADGALENVRLACADLGVELHEAKTPHMNAIFADSLRRHSNVCDGCFKTVYTLSMGLARERGIDTIITGLSRGQLFETRLADTFAAREFDPDRIDRWVMEARKAYHHIDDAVYQLLESDLFRTDAIFEDIRFIDFYRFVDVDLDEVYRYLAAETVWKRPADTGRSTNCLINDVGIHVHKRTRGFHNYALPYSWDVRLGHKRREAAIQELDDDIDIERVQRILGEIGYEPLLDDVPSDKRLAAYYVASEGLSSSDLRAHLAARLPAYMVPTHLVPLRALPLTVNGKVDRAALPDPRRVRSDLATTFTAPTTEAERRLAAIWSGVFRLPEIGVHDNFFDLGGDSIMSIQIVAEARRQGMSLSARDIFTHQTLADLARHVTSDAIDGDQSDRAVAPGRKIELDEDARQAIASQLSEAGGWDAIEDVYPLTATQLGMLYHSLRSADPQTYFGQGTCTLSGPVDAGKLEEAWRVVCQRHPATRVRFVWSGLDTPLQVVQREVAFPWEHHDWRGRGIEDARRGIDDLRRRHRATGFDLHGPTLMSFALVRTDDANHFVWNSHHALLDGWAAHLLFDEALNEYEALVSGAPRAPLAARPFRDHVDWLGEQDEEAARRWWKEHLSGLDGPTPFPLLASSPGDEKGHGSVVRTLDATATARVQDFTRARRITLSTLANGVWALLLSHYSGANEVVFGSTVSGREDGVRGVESMVGMLIATLPTRLRVDPDRSIGEWLGAAQLDALEARRHGHLGLADIQRLAGVPATQALFDAIVVVENFPTTRSSGGSSLQPSDFEIGAPSNYALALAVHPGEQLKIEAIFDRSRLSSETVARMLGHFEEALTSMAGNAERRIGDVHVVTESERSTLRAWGTGASAPVPDRLVHELIAEHAAANPRGLAVAGPGGELTYRELERRANQLAHGLREMGVERGHCVGLVAGSHPLLVAGVQAILKASAIYVPIDPEIPSERLAHMMRETGMRVLLADGEFLSPDGSNASVIDLSAFSFDGHEPEPPASGPKPDDVAYVIYTSGSTGMPKGVMVTHRNIAHSTAARFSFYGEGVESFLLLSPLAFDSSMVGLFWTLSSGGTLVMPPGEQRHNVRFLTAEIERHGITHLLALPSLYALILDEAPPGQLKSLRTVMVAGEACPATLLDSHRSRCPGATLYNEYGPTEGTVWSHAFRVTDDFDGPGVPIGAPIPNSSCKVLDRFGHPAAVEVPGELVIGGPGVAAGYLRRPDLTEQAFEAQAREAGLDPDERHYRTGDLVRWRSDGHLDFLGRVDRQVKLRGHRIELDEIERVLLDSPGVRGAAVIVAGVDQSDGSRRRLVAYYCADESLDDAALQTAVASRLPRYMLPSSFVRLDELPLTATGKLDRQALPPIAATPPRAPDVSREPTDGLEGMLRDAWARVLGRPDVGVDQNFFELGGNSLDAMRLFARIERVTGRSMMLSALFEAPTIASLAEALRKPARDTAVSSLVPIKPGGYKRPFYYVGPYEISVLELGRLAKDFDPDRPFFGIQPSGLQEGERIHETVEEMASHYVAALKTQQPTGPYLIGGHCDGTWVAHEMAIQLRDRGETVAYLALVDIAPPAQELPPRGWLANVMDRIAYYRRDGRLGYALAYQLKLRLENELLLRFGSAASRRVRAVRQAHKLAFGRYRIEHDHRTPLHLVRSTELASTMDQISWYEGLRGGGNEVVVTDIESTHARLLMEPETKELAQVLSRGLEAAESRA